MSEYTPLTEAERAAALYDDLHAEVLAEPVGSIARRLHRALGDLAHTVLAARTSTATADTGLRERVEAELRSEDATAVLYGVVGTHPDSYGGVTKDEALEHACDLLRRLRAILDATAAPTSDTGARDE